MSPGRAYVGERADWIAGLVRAAQADGEFDPALPPDALAHFCLLLAMGSAVVTPDLHPVGEEDWAALLARVAAAFAAGRAVPAGAVPAAAQAGAAQAGPGQT